LIDTYSLPPTHAPGRVLADLAVTIADGGDALRHLWALRDQAKLFGQVPRDRGTPQGGPPGDIDRLVAVVQRGARRNKSGDNLPVSATSVRRVHATLSSALSDAVKRRLIPYNPALQVDLPPAELAVDRSRLHPRGRLGDPTRVRDEALPAPRRQGGSADDPAP
jgi:hypothetical protein